MSVVGDIIKESRIIGNFSSSAAGAHPDVLYSAFPSLPLPAGGDGAEIIVAMSSAIQAQFCFLKSTTTRGSQSLRQGSWEGGVKSLAVRVYGAGNPVFVMKITVRCFPFV